MTPSKYHISSSFIIILYIHQWYMICDFHLNIKLVRLTVRKFNISLVWLRCIEELIFIFMNVGNKIHSHPVSSFLCPRPGTCLPGIEQQEYQNKSFKELELETVLRDWIVTSQSYSCIYRVYIEMLISENTGNYTL